ncbi:protein of unknown function [Candidatus Methylomirabilis oxygeniifera]|uniref:Uncharacterized protein n=1 Tax=Methylomirabilis oxygeniifera TaxID=671143 RepID=D5MHC9_METO1|nr:protein of unknown function [Candidatus Methylomirabilis oxyfera]
MALEHGDRQHIIRLDRYPDGPSALPPYRFQALHARTSVTPSQRAVPQPPLGGRQPPLLRPSVANNLLEYRGVDLPCQRMDDGTQRPREQHLRTVCSLTTLIANLPLHSIPLFVSSRFHASRHPKMIPRQDR